MRTILAMAALAASLAATGTATAQTAGATYPDAVAPPGAVTVDIQGAPFRGGANAIVDVVEFCDFQCGFCAQAQPVLKEAQRRYGAYVRVIWRDFPLERHTEAGDAAETAYCAGEQGKFWPMHDRLFASQDTLYRAAYRDHAKALGLDMERFVRCLDSGKHEQTWARGVSLGRSYGVSGTPSFFVNGRFLEGIDDPNVLYGMIEQELAARGVSVQAAQ